MNKPLYIKNTRILLQKVGSLKYPLWYTAHCSLRCHSLGINMVCVGDQCCREFSLFKHVKIVHVWGECMCGDSACFVVVKAFLLYLSAGFNDV